MSNVAKGFGTGGGRAGNVMNKASGAPSRRESGSGTRQNSRVSTSQPSVPGAGRVAGGNATLGSGRAGNVMSKPSSPSGRGRVPVTQ